MVNSVNFKKFRTSEYVQFFVDICTIYEENDAESLNLAEQRTKLVDSNVELAKVFKQAKGSDITEEIASLDQRRDEAIICLRRLAEAYTHHFDAAKKEAGRKLLKAIDKYGSKIYMLNYQAETSTITNLVYDLESITELIEAITLLAILDVVNELKTSNNIFNQRYLERIQEEAAKENVTAGELIKAGINAYRNLVSHTEAHATLNPSDAYTALINQLNELINKYNETVSARSEADND